MAFLAWTSLRLQPASLALALSCMLPLHARAEPYAVVASYGDTAERTCSVQLGGDHFIGTLGGGVVRERADERLRLGTLAGLPGERVRDCIRAWGTLLVATEAGLARWDLSSGRFVTLARGRYQKLAVGGAVVLAADAHGRVQRVQRARVHAVTQVDFVPTALALSKTGALAAVGGMSGEVALLAVVLPDAPARAAASAVRQRLLARPTGMVRAEPITALRFTREALHVDGVDHRVVYPRTPSGVAASAATLHALQRAPAASLPAPDALATTDRMPCGDRITSLAVHEGALWIGSFDRGLCRFDGVGFSHFAGPSSLPSDMVNDLVSDGVRLYVATARGLAVRHPDGRFQRFVHTQCQPDLRAPCPWYASVNGVAVDAKTAEAVVVDIGSLHTLQWTPWPQPPQPPQPLESPVSPEPSVRFTHLGGSAIGSSALTRVAAFAGQIAVASSDAGLLLGHGPKLRRSERIDAHAGLADDWVMDVSFDAQGRLWAATCTRGVSVRDTHGGLRTLTTRDGLIDDYTLSVNVIDGALWAGTLSGVSIFDAESGVHRASLSVADGLSGNEVHDAVAFGGDVWLATDAGLSVVRVAQVSGDAAPQARYAVQP